MSGQIGVYLVADPNITEQCDNTGSQKVHHNTIRRGCVLVEKNLHTVFILLNASSLINAPPSFKTKTKQNLETAQKRTYIFYSLPHAPHFAKLGRSLE